MLRYITRKKVAHKEPGPSIHLKKQGQRTRGAGRELIGWRDEANKAGTRVDETQVREHENLICITQNHNPKNDGLQSGQYDSLRPQNDGGRSPRGGIASPGQTDRRTPVCPPTVSPPLMELSGPTSTSSFYHLQHLLSIVPETLRAYKHSYFDNIRTFQKC